MNMQTDKESHRHPFPEYNKPEIFPVRIKGYILTTTSGYVIEGDDPVPGD